MGVTSDIESDCIWKIEDRNKIVMEEEVHNSNKFDKKNIRED